MVYIINRHAPQAVRYCILLKLNISEHLPLLKMPQSMNKQQYANWETPLHPLHSLISCY